jgi:Tfp pilus assembly protein PilF
MDILFAFSVILIWILVCIVARFVTTFIHEIGHAIPALFFTDKDVFVFIGSYADPAQDFGIKMGRLTLFFRLYLLRLDIGMCGYNGKVSISKEWLITLCGPLFSLVMAVMSIVIINTIHFSDTMITVIAVFTISFIWDFIINMIPTSNPQLISGGTLIYNDGAQLKRLFSQNRFPEKYFKAIEIKEAGEAEGAAEIFEDLISEGNHKRVIYQHLIESYISAKTYPAAIRIFEKYAARFKLKAFDYYLFAKSYLFANHYSDAILMIQKAIHLDYQNAIYLILYGRCLIELGEYERAILKLTASIQYAPNLMGGYLYRGLANIKLERMPAALADLTKAKELEPEHRDLYLYFGFYYKSLGQKHHAIKNFEKAKALGSDHHGLDFFIEELKAKIF